MGNKCSICSVKLGGYFTSKCSVCDKRLCRTCKTFGRCSECKFTEDEELYQKQLSNNEYK